MRELAAAWRWRSRRLEARVIVTTIIGGLITGTGMDAKSESTAAWVSASIAFGGVLAFVGYEGWRRSRGPLPRVGPVGPSKPWAGPKPAPHLIPDDDSPPGDPNVSVALVPTPGYRLLRSANAFGTQKTIMALVRDLACYRTAQPTAPQLVIGDISKKGGGHLSPHLSHQEGRDVDIRNPPSSLLLWQLTRCFVLDPDVEVIFSSTARQREMVDAAAATGDGPLAAAAMQVSCGRSMCKVRDWPGHGGHLHVRFWP